MEPGKYAFLERDSLEIGLSLNYGPRISLLRYQGGPNLMVQMPEPALPEDWAVYGGHRVWAAPEHPVRSYWPDNSPPLVQKDGDTKVSAWNVDGSGLRRTVGIEMLDAGSCLVRNEITNFGEESQVLASWGITSLIPGGIGLMPFGSCGKGLNPNRQLAFWPYTQIKDPSIEEFDCMICVDQQKLTGKFKIGTWHEAGWLAYLVQDWLFVKRSEARQPGNYPDLNSNLEIYGDLDMLELETLAPLTNLEPGESMAHTEQWWLRQVASSKDKTERLEMALDLVVALLGD